MAIQTRICPWCGIEFTTDQHAQKFCSVKCRTKAAQKAKKNMKSQKATLQSLPYICAYCGTKIEGRKKKYCGSDCRLMAHGIRKKTTPKNKQKNFMSLEEVARESRKLGISAGEYMQKFCYGKER